jgi:hypothetical protein
MKNLSKLEKLNKAMAKESAKVLAFFDEQLSKLPVAKSNLVGTTIVTASGRVYR